VVTRIDSARAGALVVLCFVLAALVAVAFPGAAAEPTPPADHANAGACANCHETPHEASVSKACETCHTPKDWKPSTFDVAAHAKTAFPLDGKHTEVACQRCHAEAKLTGLPTDCAECHVDRHRGKLGQNCKECHSTQGFQPVANFDHARTGFVLEGHHTGVECASCHEGDNGKKMRLVATSTCDTCHTSTHGDFGRPCSECHTDNADAFADARSDFAHAGTGFALERRHLAQPCGSCHVPGKPVPSPACTSCHTDVHAGQLGMQCDDCHQPDRWRLARFDHDLTGWVLRGRHFVTPCADCHTGERWVGLATECYDCHAQDVAYAPDTVAAHNQPRATCQDCHNTWAW
jgi:hypothetical protein